MEPAFQSDEPFGDSYIEAPDAAYAPAGMPWQRQDTNFQLLVYYDPPTKRVEGRSSDTGTGSNKRPGKGAAHGDGAPSVGGESWQKVA